MKKKYAAGLLAACLLLALLPGLTASRADDDFVYTVVENRVMTPIAQETFSFHSGNTYYVYYEYFDKLDNIHAFYSERLQQVVVYNKNTILYFDLANDLAYTNTDRSFDNTARWKNGYIFLPLDVVSKSFGLSTGHMEGDNILPAPMLRINSSSFGEITNQAFAASQREYMNSLYTQYIQAQEISSTEPSTQPTTAPPQLPKLVYLLFDGPVAAQNAEIVLDALDHAQLGVGVKAAFFVQPDQIVENGDLLRRLYSQGHTIGIRIPDGWDDPLQAAEIFEEANSLLKSVIFTKTRLVAVGGQSAADVSTSVIDALVDQGCRLWNSTISLDLSGAVTVRNLMSAARTELGRARGTAVLGLDWGDTSAALLPQLLDYITTGNYQLITVTDWDTPINLWDERR